ncbi:acyltransferase [Actinophytocola sp.]|uniref:acyltransferase family protein n=1 Tax=Actinophytocola sp. TaxID=1872138 RepID=UPI002ED1E054
MTERPRLEVLDGLRFLAAFAVVAYHFTTMDRVWQRPAVEIFPDQTAAYGWLGVYLFFLISGFVICMSAWDRGVGSFFLSRVVRLYPAYWLSVLAIAAVLTLYPWNHRGVTLDWTLVNLTMFQDAVGVPPVAEVYWTLWAELRFYLLFSLIVWWGLTYQRVAGFCVVWLGLVTVCKAVVPDDLIVHTVLMTDYAPLFTGGIGCYLMYRFGPTLVSWGIVAASFVLSTPAALHRAGLESYPGEEIVRWPAVVWLAGCFLLVIAVALGWLSRVRGRWLVVLGATTYPLYLLHLDLGGPILFSAQWSVPPALLVAVVTAAMIALAWLVHRYVERPLAPLLKRGLLSLGTRVSRTRQPESVR